MTGGPSHGDHGAIISSRHFGFTGNSFAIYVGHGEVGYQFFEAVGSNGKAFLVSSNNALATWVNAILTFSTSNGK